MDIDPRFPPELVEQVLKSLAWHGHGELTPSERWAVECCCDAILYDRKIRSNEPVDRFVNED